MRVALRGARPRRRAGCLSRLQRRERVASVLLVRSARAREGARFRWRWRWLLRRLLRLRSLARVRGGGAAHRRSARAARSGARRPRRPEAEGRGRGDRDRARARRPLRELRVPRREERARPARAADHDPALEAPACAGDRRGGRGQKRGRHRRLDRRARARGRRGADGRDLERRGRVPGGARRTGGPRQGGGRADRGGGAARSLARAGRLHPSVGVRFAAVSAVRVEHVDELVGYAEATAACTRCRLAQGRTQVVFGAGNPRADLLFVGEAPGFHEDKQGLPFVGQAGKLLEKLLTGIGMTRQDVYIANVLKCRPPGNRDPQPDEIEACETHLFRQIELIEPTVVATLGNFATKLLSGRPLGITRVHGQEQETTIGSRTVLLYPLYHPAAALYTPAMLKVLEADFARLPELLGRTLEPLAAPEPEPALTLVAASEQLVLF